MSLSEELSKVYDIFHTTAPPALTVPVRDATSSIKAAFDPSKAIQPGHQFPSFSLDDANHHTVTSESLLSKGPLLITFYRGSWCPFCNLTLRAYQQHLQAFRKRGVQFVAITPELPDTSISSVEKQELEYPVLSDVGCKLARQLGIVWAQPDTMRPIFDHLGVDWDKDYGNGASERLEVPIPATILVGKDSVVMETFIEANYHERLDPEIALSWLDKHQL
ncbi:uncharacterized protein HMPREF1541_05820 [Cyphellophora europaea CBS 101466]|uniref:thioredoxin-dependent peroxiredoxin n=1 Tax=Cyphellophora europaea (strain CBS 101466) TaxID=1220924 RepID=W2RV59_CYPE1|nr:uncharacterized protein HMPREF1541_05820 [Cyphellophora europaea CBS 101466]ETN39594.1 hypothetical protein HMPREF1541_05820 [Cyphellophora europaea CBS 101466]